MTRVRTPVSGLSAHFSQSMSQRDSHTHARQAAKTQVEQGPRSLVALHYPSYALGGGRCVPFVHARAFPRAHHPATDAGSHCPASARAGVLRRRVRRGRPRGRLLLRQRLPHVPGLLPGRLLAVPRGGRLRLTTTATIDENDLATTTAPKKRKKRC